MAQFISKKALLAWLEKLIQERILIAPVRTNGLLLFQLISRVEDIVLNSNTELSPKECFFPATETLFTVRTNDGHTELVAATVDRETVIFGLRPCDAMGIALIDRPFLAEPADTLYGQHRARTILVGLSCSQPKRECFCTSLGGGPDDATHLDILLTEVEDGYIVQAVTERGKEILPPVAERELPLPPTPSLEAIPTEGLTEVMTRFFEAPYWSRLADRCLHCNICAYVCPTCYCFDVRDYAIKGTVERVRSWESCQSPGFTRIAGGYDPRSTKGARLRQRFYHKLLYFPEQFGAQGCVGCGRCVRACPVNIDIREIISDIQRMGAKGGA